MYAFLKVLEKPIDGISKKTKRIKEKKLDPQFFSRRMMSSLWSKPNRLITSWYYIHNLARLESVKLAF
jgi:hypothetical protein